MIGTIHKGGLDTDYRICSQRTLYTAFRHTFFDCREVILRNSTAEHLLLEYIWMLQISRRFKDHLNIAVLTMTA